MQKCRITGAYCHQRSGSTHRAGVDCPAPAGSHCGPSGRRDPVELAERSTPSFAPPVRALACTASAAGRCVGLGGRVPLIMGGDRRHLPSCVLTSLESRCCHEAGGDERHPAARTGDRHAAMRRSTMRYRWWFLRCRRPFSSVRNFVSPISNASLGIASSARSGPPGLHERASAPWQTA